MVHRIGEQKERERLRRTRTHAHKHRHARTHTRRKEKKEYHWRRGAESRRRFHELSNVRVNDRPADGRGLTRAVDRSWIPSSISLFPPLPVPRPGSDLRSLPPVAPFSVSLSLRSQRSLAFPSFFPQRGISLSRSPFRALVGFSFRPSATFATSRSVRAHAEREGEATRTENMEITDWKDGKRYRTRVDRTCDLNLLSTSLDSRPCDRDHDHD